MAEWRGGWETFPWPPGQAGRTEIRDSCNSPVLRPSGAPVCRLLKRSGCSQEHISWAEVTSCIDIFSIVVISQLSCPHGKAAALAVFSVSILFSSFNSFLSDPVLLCLLFIKIQPNVHNLKIQHAQRENSSPLSHFYFQVPSPPNLLKLSSTFLNNMLVG